MTYPVYPKTITYAKMKRKLKYNRLNLEQKRMILTYFYELSIIRKTLIRTAFRIPEASE
jgi:hypothetical protein